MQTEQQEIYRPAIDVARITDKQALVRFPIVLLKKPGHICGFAKRIDYIGKEATGLAIYRLKLQTKRGSMKIMLPSLFVVEGTFFSTMKPDFRPLKDWKEKVIQRVLVMNRSLDSTSMFRFILDGNTHF